MSLFSDIQGQAGGEMLFDTNGSSAIYVARGGVETNVTGLLGDTKIIERNTSTGIVKVRTREYTIWNYAHAVYGGVVEPSLSASFSIAGELWSISGIAANSANFWRLALEATGTRYKTREQAFGNP